MTTIRQLIQTNPARANELFAKLVDTSDTALKTRDRILGELKGELEMLAALEEEHLFPVLRKHKETKDLVAEAIADNKATAKLLAELERTPRDDKSFAPKVAELRRAFQKSVRDERKELLPAVLKVLGDEEAQAVVGRIEDGKAEVEEARRAEAGQRRAEARQERDEAERREAEREAAAKRERETRAAAKRAVTDAAEVTREVSREVAQGAAAGVQGAAAGIQGAAAGVQRAAAASTASGSLFWDAMFGMWGMPRAVARTGQGTTIQHAANEEEVIPLAEETLVVGKRTEERGTTRVRRYVVETPVEQHVTLYDERVVVERRRPVTNAATGETLTELTIEVVETAEVPVVAKGVRVTEEVVVRRERTKRVEVVRDTLRRDEVEILNDADRPARARPALAHARK